MEKICSVCQTPISAVWMCGMSNCPKDMQLKMTADRKKYREDQEAFGRPDRAEKDPHHERF